MKRYIKALIVLLCVCTAFITASAFEDMPNDWSTEALQSAIDNGLLKGDGNKILPADNLTRAQMATILVRALGATKLGDISAFDDVSSSSWYHDAMATAYKMGIFKGDDNMKLTPDSPITRQEAFVVIARALSLSASTTSGINSFSDAADVAAWAKRETEALIANGYVAGSGGKINPKSNITRAEFAKLMDNIVADFIDTPEELEALGNEINGNVIIRGSAVKALKKVTVNGDVIIGDSAENFEFNDCKINGRVVFRGEDTKVSFDGDAKEFVIAGEKTKLVVSNTSTINKVDKKYDSSSFEVEKDNTTITPINPQKPVNPKPEPEPEPEPTPEPEPEPEPKPEPEEDLWTEFH